MKPDETGCFRKALPYKDLAERSKGGKGQNYV